MTIQRSSASKNLHHKAKTDINTSIVLDQIRGCAQEVCATPAASHSPASYKDALGVSGATGSVPVRNEVFGPTGFSPVKARPTAPKSYKSLGRTWTVVCERDGKGNITYRNHRQTKRVVLQPVRQAPKKRNEVPSESWKLSTKRLREVYVQKAPGVNEWNYYSCLVDDDYIDQARDSAMMPPPAPRGGGKPGPTKRRANLNNKGTGGKSKVPRAPLPPSPVVEAAAPVAPGEVVEGENEDAVVPPNSEAIKLARDRAYELLSRNFVYSKHPMVSTTHGVPTQLGPRADCGGAPYCGMTAIDVACGIEPNIKEYFARTTNLEDPTVDVGGIEFLFGYAAFRGVNLNVTYHAINGPMARGHRVSDQVKEPNYAWRWVNLELELPNGDDGAVGHYLLICQENASDSGVIITVPESTYIAELPSYLKIFLVMLAVEVLALLGLFAMVLAEVDLDNGGRRLDKMGVNGNFFNGVEYFAFNFWPNMFCLVMFCRTFFVVQIVCSMNRRWVGRSNLEKRIVSDRRDKVTIQDTYREVDCTTRLGITTFFWEPIVADTGFRFDRRLVSEVRFHQAYVEMQALVAQGLTGNKALPTVARLREVNTDTQSTPIIFNTMWAVEQWERSLEGGERNVVNTRGLVQYNTPNNQAHIPDIEVIGANQCLMARGGGVIKTNSVLKYRLEEPKVDRPIAVLPIGGLLTDKGVLSCGQYSLTDSPGILSAFIGRSMTKDLLERDATRLSKFIDFSKTFVDKFVDDLDVTGLVEPSIPDHLRAFYKGKKSHLFIETKIAEWERYNDGLMCAKELKKYKAHSCFCKFESNVKKGKIRPRLIMTESGLMSAECSRVTLLYDRWNHGSFSKYQVKDMSAEEVVAKVMDITNGHHVVTDFSSYESSIDIRFREIENHATLALCAKAGFFETKAAYEKHAVGGRIMKTKWGKLEIYSRCSGDFWTSFGNGLVNVCAAAFAADEAGVELNMIAEGDDGVIKDFAPSEETYDEIGLKFSSALAGTSNGDCDFLRATYRNGKKYLNVGRCLSILWVKKGAELKKSKQLFLLRAMASSFYHMSPGHPVITALVNRINRETAGYSSFKSYEKYLDMWGDKGKYYGTKVPVKVEVDVSMRQHVSDGAEGFPPISIAEQLELERRIEEDEVMYLGTLLNDYDDVIANTVSIPDSSELSTSTNPLKEAVAMLNDINTTVGGPGPVTLVGNPFALIATRRGYGFPGDINFP